MAEPLPSDRKVLVCKTCGVDLSPREIHNSTGLAKFAIAEGRCPLCLFNIIVRLAPPMHPVNPTPQGEQSHD